MSNMNDLVKIGLMLEVCKDNSTKEFLWSLEDWIKEGRYLTDKQSKALNNIFMRNENNGLVLEFRTKEAKEHNQRLDILISQGVLKR